MNILIVMIPLSILLLVGAGIAFFWAVDHDQFDDLDTPRLLPLLDNPDAPANEAGVTSRAAAGSDADAGGDAKAGVGAKASAGADTGTPAG
ncbi:MAG: cbb3-type cytochrome oxidase assembly protein CcoS [Steroidobacteraceae bacterium]|nr:cbb3-type cytochrome oxidase assembly protein CcoS [Steroidobacteraceae bacterium]